MRKALAGLMFVLAASVAWAMPSEQQVQDAVKQGNYTQAQSMMAEVVAEKPNSAKAHYVYAELLAHNGAFGKASEEVAKARALDPKIGFTDPEKFRSFEQTLQREQNTARPARTSAVTTPGYGTTAPASSGGGIPGWVWLVGLVVIGILLFQGFARSRAAAGTPGPGYGPTGMNQGYGPAGPYGPGGAPVAQSGGSGLLGTGLAVAGGVAGGMLLDEMLHRRDGGSGNIIGGDGGGGGGGFIPDASASELENRSIDFGNGNDWDSGGGGGVDLGGGGGDGGGSWD